MSDEDKVEKMYGENGLPTQESFLVHMSEWNKVNEFKDCPPLNKKVFALHDDQIFIGIFEKEGDDGYLWRL